MKVNSPFEKYWGGGIVSIAVLIALAIVLCFTVREELLSRLDSLALILAAIMMGWAAWSNRSLVFEMRDQDKYSVHRRRINEIQTWVNDVLKLRATFMLCESGFESSRLVSDEWNNLRKVNRLTLISQKAFILKEVEYLDQELLKDKSDIKELIEYVVSVLEQDTSLFDEGTSSKIENACVSVLTNISEAKVKLKI